MSALLLDDLYEAAGGKSLMMCIPSSPASPFLEVTKEMGVVGVMRTGTKAIAVRKDDNDRMGMPRSSMCVCVCVGFR